MKYEEINGLRILTAQDERHKIKRKETGEYFEKVYLGKYENVEDYCDISIYEIQGYNDDVGELKATIDERQDEMDMMIINLSTELAILKLTL